MTLDGVRMLALAMARANNHPDPEAWAEAVVEHLSKLLPKPTAASTVS